QINNMNAYGIDANALIPGLNGNIWGSAMLVLVDGIPRDLGNIIASEIEQISVLKGVGAVALYGSMAAKGVIVVTTKSGILGDNVIMIWANCSVYVSVTYPTY